MNVSRLLSVLAAGLVCGLAGLAVFDHVGGAKLTALAQSPSPVGAWWGIARPCPAVGDDAGHAALCESICGTCPNIPGTLPPEVPMMPSILGDGNVVVNDAGSIPIFHTTAQGQWAQDNDKSVLQIAGRTRYQASFVWLQGSADQISVRGLRPSIDRQFVGVARPRFVTFFDEKTPDDMQGFIQPHFFPITDEKGIVNVLPSTATTAFLTNHYPALNFLAPLPKGCDPSKGCLGTFHFTIHRIKPNVPN
jgi:hypothetical protein